MAEMKYNVRGLESLIKALKVRQPKVRVGILDGHNSRSGKDGSTNAEIGAAHEYGTVNMVQRSFLRVPLQEFLDKKLEESGAFNKDTFRDVIKEGTLLPWLQKIASIAEQVVIGAFDSGGYGQWSPWVNPNYENNTGLILVDTQQLRNSITSDVKA